MSYLAISQYVRDHGIDGADRDIFMRLFRAIDAEWLTYIEEQKPKD